jgi:hypothetical protein
MIFFIEEYKNRRLTYIIEIFCNFDFLCALLSKNPPNFDIRKKNHVYTHQVGAEAKLIHP